MSEDSVPDREVEDDSSHSHVGISKGKIHGYCVAGAQEEGIRSIVLENHLEVCEVSLNRLKRKSDVGSFIL